MSEEEEINQVKTQESNQMENQELSQGQIQTQVEEQQVQFKKLVYIKFLVPGFEDTMVPSYVLYKLGGFYYSVAVSKLGRIAIVGKIALLKTRNDNIAICAVPEYTDIPGGEVIDYIQIENVEVTYNNGIAKIQYLRNGEHVEFSIPQGLQKMLKDILDGKDIIALDALIYYTHY
ncbi:hypothetical protein QIT30_gp35 [Saccharolobus solfataricus rod-shaped virus 1]|uniref:Uncharacterized protein n=1 Tax=Saccharolobus solfataricus rod-shaped virus 1 TaxID=2730619 RepID=A0A6M3VYG7_SSRV1|nr:hypothetical protein QIT30_gp35 [Saccharolobus solfataricus rod-shaped virus 1]QJF12311.1 hypothetical protein SSRV1_gp35 [Saccharolobus solfataricus rod-shaped virus 1]